MWRCCTRVNEGPKACNAPTLREDELQEKVMQAINMAWGSKSTVIEQLKVLAEQCIKTDQQEQIDAIDTELGELQKELVRKALANEDYQELVDRVEGLKKKKQQILVEQAMDKGKELKRDEMVAFLETQSSEIEKYDEQLVRRLIESITVREDASLIVEFKSGASVKVQ